MQRVPAGRSTSTRRSPENRVRGALSRSRVMRLGWFMRLRTWRAGRSGGVRQIERGPRVCLGEQRQAAIGVHGGGMSDHAQHRNVRVAVAEGETFVQVVAVL